MFKYAIKAKAGQKVYAVSPETRVFNIDVRTFSGYLYFNPKNVIVGTLSHYVIYENGTIDYAIKLNNEPSVSVYVDQHFCFTTVEGLVKFMSFVSKFTSTQTDIIRKECLSKYPFAKNIPMLNRNNYTERKKEAVIFESILSHIYGFNSSVSKYYFHDKGESIFEAPKMVFKSVKPIIGWFEPNF